MIQPLADLQASPIPVPNIVSFSGGLTSGYMLRRLMDSEPHFGRRFRVLFCNTGKEHDATLDFVHEVEKQWGVAITWLEYCRVPAADIPLEFMPEGRKRENLRKQQEAGETAHWFKVVSYETAARYYDPTGPFDELLDWLPALPNVRMRACSSEMKVRTMRRYLNQQGVLEWNDYIGIRADEAHRKLEILANTPGYQLPRFPLIEWGTDKETVNAFWRSQPFRLNLPQVNGETIDGNCRQCFLKAFWKRVMIQAKDPTAALWWHGKELEFRQKAEGDGAVFRRGQPFAKVIKVAAALPGAPTPPRAKDKRVPVPQPALDFTEADVPCSCAVGAYRGNAQDDDDTPHPIPSKTLTET
jgi:3'-phosphoadenosine 5'-phosphosulfate sulfotransferase (PAPS reductase)/FAD synthetase